MSVLVIPCSSLSPRKYWWLSSINTTSEVVSFISFFFAIIIFSVRKQTGGNGSRWTEKNCQNPELYRRGSVPAKSWPWYGSGLCGSRPYRETKSRHPNGSGRNFLELLNLLCCLFRFAAEQKARSTYDNILRMVKDPDVADPIRFLRAREIVHFQRFGEALRISQDNLNSRNFYAFNPSFDK